MSENDCPEPIAASCRLYEAGEQFHRGKSGLLYYDDGTPLAAGVRPDVEATLLPNCVFLPGELERMQQDIWAHPEWLDHRTNPDEDPEGSTS